MKSVVGIDLACQPDNASQISVVCAKYDSGFAAGHLFLATEKHGSKRIFGANVGLIVLFDQYQFAFPWKLYLQTQTASAIRANPCRSAAN